MAAQPAALNRIPVTTRNKIAAKRCDSLVEVSVSLGIKGVSPDQITVPGVIEFDARIGPLMGTAYRSACHCLFNYTPLFQVVGVGT